MSENKSKDLKKEASFLNIDGTIYRTRLTGKFTSRIVWDKPDEKKLLSFIPGTINKVFVEKGQKVKKGEKVVILEAMKMQNKILIPRDGIIKQVYVKEGQTLPKGALILELK